MFFQNNVYTRYTAEILNSVYKHLGRKIKNKIELHSIYGRKQKPIRLEDKQRCRNDKPTMGGKFLYLPMIYSRTCSVLQKLLLPYAVMHASQRWRPSVLSTLIWLSNPFKNFHHPNPSRFKRIGQVFSRGGRMYGIHTFTERHRWCIPM